MERTQPRNRKRSEVLLLLAPVLAFVALVAIGRYREHREVQAEAQFRAELNQAQRNSIERNHLLAQLTRLKRYKAGMPVGSDKTAILQVEQQLDQQLIALDERLENEIRLRRGIPLLKTTSTPALTPTPAPTPTPNPVPLPQFQLLSGATSGAATTEHIALYHYGPSS
jgi:hypothetical protein